MSTKTVQGSSAQTHLVSQMDKSFNSWAIASLVMGAVSLVASRSFDPVWGIILLIIAVFSWKTRIPGLKDFYLVAFLIVILGVFIKIVEGSDISIIFIFMGGSFISISILGLILIYLMPVRCKKPGCSLVGTRRRLAINYDGDYLIGVIAVTMSTYITSPLVLALVNPGNFSATG